MKFAKATLEEVSNKASANPDRVGDPIELQINPASLRLQLVNNTDSGKAVQRPSTQAQGSSSSTLSFDLYFDTADEGTTENPIDVRDRTRRIEKFLLPVKGTAKGAPPRLRFRYGTFIVVGLMTSMSEDYDFFSSGGVPLRAKCSVTIKEQKPEFDAKLTGPGANTGQAAIPPLPAQPGSRSGANRPAPDRTGTALAGESAAGFTSRMGLDPNAWKGLAATLPNPLRLAAGVQIDFSSTLSVDAGLGLELGATSGASPPAVPGAVPPGPALTAAGGLTRALDHAADRRGRDAERAARGDFASAESPAATPVPGQPPGAASGTPAPFDTAPLTRPAAQPASVQAPAASVITADPRATGFGFGVPLRPRRGAASLGSLGLVHERDRTVQVAPHDGVPESDDPTVAPWLALRPGQSPASTAGRASYCGCGGTCGGCAGGGR